MKTPAPNRIAEIRKSRGLTQQSLADVVGSHWITISKLERGQMQLTGDWMAKLAAALDVRDGDLLHRSLKNYTVKVLGEFRAAQVNLAETDTPVEKTLSSMPDPWSGEWIEVVDDSLRPFFSSGDLLRFRIIGNDSAYTLVGHVVLATAPTGYAVMGTLEQSNYEPPEQNTEGPRVEGPIHVDIRAFNGMSHNALVQHLYVFDGCHVFWGTPEKIWAAK